MLLPLFAVCRILIKPLIILTGIITQSDSMDVRSEQFFSECTQHNRESCIICGKVVSRASDIKRRPEHLVCNNRMNLGTRLLLFHVAEISGALLTNLLIVIDESFTGNSHALEKVGSSYSPKI